MRIAELRLMAFGPFSDVTLDLSGGSQGLHVIAGPNEAGKSTTLDAIEQWLFGFPHQSKHDFVHPNPNLRIGGTIVDSAGRALPFVRRKGRRDTIRDASDSTSLPDTILQEHIGSISASTFRSMFGLTWQKLRREGENLLQEGGEVGPLLFAAGSGIGSLRRIQSQLRTAADQLYLKRGKKKINELIREVEDLRRRIKDLSAGSQRRKEIDDAIDRASREREQRQKDLREGEARLAHWQLCQQAYPLVIEGDRLTRSLEEMADVVRLPADFRDRHREMVARQSLLDAQLAAFHHRRDELRDKRASLTFDDELLLRSAEIEALQRDWGAIDKANRDRTELVVQERQLAQKERQIQSYWPNPAAAAPSPADLDRLESICQELDRWEEEAVRKAEELGQMARRRERIDLELQEHEPRLDPQPLAALLLEAESAGSLDEQIDRHTRALADEEHSIARRIGSLPFADRGWEDFLRIDWPTIESVEHRSAEWKRSRDHLAEMDRLLEVQHGRRREIDRQRREDSLGKQVPTLEDLAAVRRQRDEGLNAIWSAIEEGPGPDSLAFERFRGSMREADQVADRLREEAELVAIRARLDLEDQSVEIETNRLSGLRERAEASERDQWNRWKEIWANIALPVDDPAVMLPQLRAIQEIAQQANLLSDRRRLLDGLRTQREQLIERARQLVTLPSSTILWKEAARVVRTELEDETKRSATRGQLERQKRELADEEGPVRDKLVQVEEKTQRCREAWESATCRLAITGLDTRMTIDWVKSQREWREIHLQRTALAERIAGIDADQKRFDERLAGWKSGERVTVGELVERWKRASQSQTRAVEIEAQLARCDQDEATWREERRQLDADWKTLLEEACTTERSNLSQVMDASDQRRKFEQQWETNQKLLAPLLHRGGGEDFRQQVRNGSPEEWNQQESMELHRTEAWRTELSELDQSLGSLRADQRHIDGNGNAALLAQEMQEKLASLERETQRYVRLLLAEQVLQQAVEQYRRENEGPILRRAGEIFRRLTCGSFDRLEVEFDEKSVPMLVGIRPGSTQPLAVSGMSEGTADQLYLSVRLAAVEAYVANHEPIPFLVDDILINFDDQRSAATLSVLGELSQQTQVIFLTHHAHLLDIAREVLPADVLFTHELRPTMGSADAPPDQKRPTRTSKRLPR